MIAPKPPWLRKKGSLAEQEAMRALLAELRVATVCQQALCPNISECFGNGEATFLILGTRCTRHCRFCNLEKAAPERIDPDEPGRVAEGVARLKLSHVVITSPTRDDLPDGGADHYVATVAAIRERSPETRIELLIPDLQGDHQALARIITARPDVLAHNMETVPRLYHLRAGAEYGRSLELFRHCRLLAPALPLKSGLMLGLGETVAEVVEVLADLLRNGCRHVSIGHYLPPSRDHYPLQGHVTPEIFEQLKTVALQLGFEHVESSPFTRSSYHAGRYGHRSDNGRMPHAS